MADIIIKKKISLDFLGEEYKEAYLTFKSIPIDEYEKLDKIVNDMKENTGNAVKDLKLICSSYFIDGKYPDADGKLQDVQLDDIGKFNSEVISKCFETIAGVIDPKDKAVSTSPSGTTPPNQ